MRLPRSPHASNAMLELTICAWTAFLAVKQLRQRGLREIRV